MAFYTVEQSGRFMNDQQPVHVQAEPGNTEGAEIRVVLINKEFHLSQ